jgi:hypothetical protein
MLTIPTHVKQKYNQYQNNEISYHFTDRSGSDLPYHIEFLIPIQRDRNTPYNTDMGIFRTELQYVIPMKGPVCLRRQGPGHSRQFVQAFPSLVHGL